MNNDPATAKAFPDWSALSSDPSTGKAVSAVVEDAILRGDIATADPMPAPQPTPQPPRRARP